MSSSSSALNPTLSHNLKPPDLSSFCFPLLSMAPDSLKYYSADYIGQFDKLREDEHRDNCCFNLLNVLDGFPNKF